MLRSSYHTPRTPPDLFQIASSFGRYGFTLRGRAPGALHEGTRKPGLTHIGMPQLYLLASSHQERVSSNSQIYRRPKSGFVLLNLLQQEFGLVYTRELLSGSQQLFKLFASLNIIA